MKQQGGFTLIELIMVIVILGILAATALPKFIDLQDDAQLSAIQGIAGGLSSASAINYAGCLVVNHDTTDAKCTLVNSCADVGALLSPAITLGTTASAADYYISADTANTTNGTAISCELRKLKTSGGSTFWSETFTAMAGGNS